MDETGCTFGIQADEILPRMPKHAFGQVFYRKRADHELEPALQKSMPTSNTQVEVWVPTFHFIRLLHVTATSTKDFLNVKVALAQERTPCNRSQQAIHLLRRAGAASFEKPRHNWTYHDVLLQRIPHTRADPMAGLRR